jgi:hypothetical protein
MLGTVLIVLVILMLLSALPRWPHSRQWSYYPSGGLGLVLAILVTLLLLGRLYMAKQASLIKWQPALLNDQSSTKPLRPLRVCFTGREKHP